MDTTGSSENVPGGKRRTNGILVLFILVLLVGISVGLYLLNNPTAFAPRAASDTVSRCGPSGHCNDYGWNDSKGYTKVPTNCYVALYKCKVSEWNRALQVGCQRNKDQPSKDTAYYAEIHKLTSSPPPNPKLWDKIVSGSDGNGHLKPFAPPQFCGIWQIDVGPPCNKSFHVGGDKRDSICKVSQTHNACDGKACKKVKGAGQNECSNPGKDPAPQCTHKTCKNNKCVLVAGGKAKDTCQTDKDCKKTTPSPSTCPVPSPVKNLKISCPLCNLTE